MPLFLGLVLVEEWGHVPSFFEGLGDKRVFVPPPNFPQDKILLLTGYVKIKDKMYFFHQNLSTGPSLKGFGPLYLSSVLRHDFMANI